MAEALGHRGNGDSGGKHLGGHEVAQVVEPKVRQPSRPSGGDEPLRLGSQGSAPSGRELNTNALAVSSTPRFRAEASARV